MKGMDITMKHVKKLACLLLALVMVLSLSVTAFAAGETGTITIDNAVKDQTYTIYKILELESYDAASNAYAYKATTAWSSFINGNSVKGVYVNVDDQGYVTWVENASAADFAKLAQAYAKDNGISNQGSTKADGTTVTFGSLELGYYLVDTTLGTLCSLDTTNHTVTIKEKNVEPTNQKKVEEDSTGDYGEENDADIGQTVNFQSTITVPINVSNENNATTAGAQNYVFHDKMSDGLTYTSGSVKVYLNPTIDTNGKVEDSYTPVATDNYIVTAPAADGDTFDVVFTEAFCNSLKGNDKIVISYSATVNKNAVVGGNGNTNESKLSYGEEGKSETKPSTTTTYTWKMQVFKYAKDSNTEKPLAGAKFTLSKNTDDTSPITLVSEGNNVYRVATADDTSTVTEITTDTIGKFTIKGLDSDTYYLKETAAPAGYNKLAHPIKVVISDTGTVTYYEYDKDINDYPTEGATGEIQVLNQSGTELPSTGGMGTTIFYVIGSILMIGAAVLLVTKRRMNSDK